MTDDRSRRRGSAARRSGWAIETLAPAEVFTLDRARARSTPPTAPSTSRPPATALPLGLLPRGAGGRRRPRRRSTASTREAIYRSWLRTEEKTLLATASCLNDQVPAAEETDLSPFVPFLFPAGRLPTDDLCRPGHRELGTPRRPR